MLFYKMLSFGQNGHVLSNEKNACGILWSCAFIKMFEAGGLWLRYFTKTCLFFSPADSLSVKSEKTGEFHASGAK
ncbi:hypothetical protein DQG13_22935 [Paenibacillus sp. YN15]|nr:hypothetical protein DQG13_22935 [Paenibacillus sp. YN15]